VMQVACEIRTRKLEIELECELDEARIYTRAANDTERGRREIVVGISKLRVI
jgi:hypothetical protein